MILSKYKWNIQYPQNYSDNEIIDCLHKIKGIDDYTQYHNLGYKDFNDPFLFKNMDICIKKIKLSIRNNEKILIFGDYDVDGITATSILYRALKAKGALVDYQVPNRFSEGYGLSHEVLDSIINNGYKLLITVDNGITNIEEIDYLIKGGVTVILTDHHEPKETLPSTEYIIHSYIYHDYPFEHLCGAGVAYKLAEALDKDFIRNYTDLVMLGTIADMMPIKDENKAIVNEGIKLINQTNVLGLKVLLQRLGLTIRGIKDISFNIAPKLNSLGRISDASIAIDLLVSDNLDDINKDIDQLLDADSLRKTLTIQNTELAYKMISPDDKVNVIYSSSFYEGVLGIIAQKVMKKTGKITGVFNVTSDNTARGSFRTVGELNILKLLEDNKDLLDKFGGHEKACGVNMKASNIKELKERLSNALIKEDLSLEATLNVSCKLNHSLITTDFVNELVFYDLEDTLFLFKDLEVVQTQLLADKHTKVKCRLNNNKYISVLIFNDAKLTFNLAPGDLIDIVGELNINKYNGFESVQIVATDYSVESIQVIDYRYRRDFKEIQQFFFETNGLILNGEFTNINELALLIANESPNIIYLAPFEKSFDYLISTDKLLLKRALYLIDTRTESNEMILQKDLRVNKQTLNSILTILEEINLVKRFNGKVQSISRPSGQKTSLEGSQTYCELKEIKEVMDLLSGNIKDIKKFVLEALE